MNGEVNGKGKYIMKMVYYLKENIQIIKEMEMEKNNLKVNF